MKIPARKLKRFLDGATESNIIQSARRLIFTHCTQSMEELGHYYADTVYCLGGTGILIKYQNKFFLLTAKHVLTNNYSIAQNESPFFTHLFSRKGWKGMEDLGFPMRGWHIGELINQDLPNIDMQDVILIELASGILRYPDKFIDLDSPHAPKGIPLGSLYKGMFLVASGYPIDENPINYHYGDEYNCSTVIIKRILYGTFDYLDSLPILRFIDKKSHSELNGMSGGVVSNIKPKSNQTEWVGMIQKAGNGLLHFYPASWLIPAIKNYMLASHFTIDPAAHMTSLEAESTQEAINARGELYKLIKNRAT